MEAGVHNTGFPSAGSSAESKTFLKVKFHHPLSAIGTRGAGEPSIDMLLICHLFARADLVHHA